MVDPAFQAMLAILLGTTANHARRKNGKTSKLRLRLHGKGPIRRRASTARPTACEGHPSDGSPAREGSRNGQAGRSNRNNLGLLETILSPHLRVRADAQQSHDGGLVGARSFRCLAYVKIRIVRPKSASGIPTRLMPDERNRKKTEKPVR